MKKYFARDALLPAGWARDVCITVDDGGISAVESGSSGGEALHGPVLPGMANLHSHAFQRGMAGLAEVRGQNGNSADDDFWTWRELMYRFVERLPGAARTRRGDQLRRALSFARRERHHCTRHSAVDCQSDRLY